MLSACTNGDIRRYTSGASQNVRSSFWNPNAVSVRLYAPLRAMPARNKALCASRLAVMNAP